MVDWIRVASEVSEGYDDRYFNRMAWLARYGRGLDAAAVMRWWPASDVEKLMRALEQLIKDERPK